MLGLCAGFIIGLLFQKYVVYVLDIYLEKFNYKISKDCTEINLETQLMTHEAEKICKEVEETSAHAIGFEYPVTAEETDDWDEED
jgi:hypothetical protein